MKFLGKQPYAPDRLGRTLQIGKYLDLPALPPAPPAHPWSSAVDTDIGMLGNDVAGDCPYASLGHAEQVWTANSGKEWNPSAAVVLAAYSAATGYDPNQPQTDRGDTLLHALNFARQTGIDGHTIWAFAQVDQKNLPLVRACIYLFGGVICGFQLPKLAEVQFDAGKPWTVPWYGARGAAKAGSLGGHAVLVPDYTQQGFTGATWARWQAMVLRWWRAYCDECYVALGKDWVDGTRKAPSGFDLDALLADLKLVIA